MLTLPVPPEVRGCFGEPSAPRRGVEHALLSSAPSPEQRSNSVPRCLSDRWEVLILMLYSSPFFQALCSFCNGDGISSTSPLWHVQRQHVLPILSALRRGIFGGCLEQGDLTFGWSIHVPLLQELRKASQEVQKILA